MSKTIIGRIAAARSWLFVVIALCATQACAQSAPRPPQLPFDPSLVREQQRRIAAFDSVVRSINTDSAYMAWQAMLTAPDIRQAQLAMMCANANLDDRYGEAAFVALRRMEDTLWKHADRQLVARMDRRLVGESPGIGRDTCGPQPNPRAPDWLVHWYVPALPDLPPSPDSIPR
jgi:hypothetical protein